VPENWQEIPANNSAWFSPQGGFGQYNGQPVFTHGVNLGVVQTQSQNLQQATDEFVNSLAQANRSLRQIAYQRTSVSGRNALLTTLTNINEATGQPETIRLITTQLRNGQLFFMIALAPQDETRDFSNAFNNILRSLQLND
jgi:hypothetical protein